MIEIELEKEYRQYSNAKMLECLEDAISIVNQFLKEKPLFLSEETYSDIATKIAISLYNSRVPHAYFYKNRRKAEKMKVKEAKQ